MICRHDSRNMNNLQNHLLHEDYSHICYGYSFKLVCFSIFVWDSYFSKIAYKTSPLGQTNVIFKAGDPHKPTLQLSFYTKPCKNAQS